MSERALPAERRRNLDAGLLLCEAWLVGAVGRSAAVVELLRPGPLVRYVLSD